MINVVWHLNDLSHFFTCNAFRLDQYGNIKKQQGFTAKADRKTFRGGANWESDVLDLRAHTEFKSRMTYLREQLAVGWTGHL